jgi:hypothetical protein
VSGGTGPFRGRQNWPQESAVRPRAAGRPWWSVPKVGRRSVAGLICSRGAPCHALQGEECGAPCVDRAYDLAAFTYCWPRHRPRSAEEAVEQGDAADEARLEAGGSIIIGAFRGQAVIVDESKVVRASQLISSVVRTNGGAAA